MPLTLITGIYGMNFHNMPELSWSYGYLFVMLAMSVIVGAMLWGFWRTGWFTGKNERRGGEGSMWAVSGKA